MIPTAICIEHPAILVEYSPSLSIFYELLIIEKKSCKTRGLPTLVHKLADI